MTLSSRVATLLFVIIVIITWSLSPLFPKLILFVQSHSQPPSRPPPPQYSAPRGPVKPGQHHRLGTPHHGPPPPAGASNKADKLQIPPDPFTRKISRLPKKHLTQSSSRFQPKKLPPDYKPLPLLKGIHHNVTLAWLWLIAPTRYNVCICIMIYIANYVSGWKGGSHT